jgi:uncharacterized NAD(P)/FAD-binding protein YdhS
MPNRIVIVGGGFSGTVLAANLLRRPPPGCTEIVLLERGSEIGRGLAYAEHDYPHLLNVPAGRLSADALEPLQFLRFAQQTLPDADAEDFLPRQLYGAYLQDFLRQAERASAGAALLRLRGEATGIARDAERGLLVTETAAGAALAARRVILAVGNPPPPVAPWAAALDRHPAYHANPWGELPRLGEEQTALILGNGLTMADVASALSHAAPRSPRITTLSRRGLVPLPQSTFHAAAVRGDGAGLLEFAGSIRQLLVATRAMAREVSALGGDWREVVTFVRNMAPTLWQRLPAVERRRFMRHLQGHWDVHRHRLPPVLAERIDELRRSGHLQVNAGRIDAVTAEGDRLRVSWRRRGSAVTQTLVVDALVNATGPDYSLRRTRDRLLQRLRRDGLIAEDGLDLGLRTCANGGCIGADGAASERLFYLGPMLRAYHWEATAATELRNHAERLSRHLIQLGA